MANAFLDNLKRAYEMEERMATVLIDMCEPAMIENDNSDKDIKNIRKHLLGIQKDTLRHKEIVRALVERLSKGRSDG